MDELEYYRREVQRLALRVEEMKSSWSYRLSAPVRLIERAVHSIRKRTLRANILKFRTSVFPSAPPSALSQDAAQSYAQWIALFDIAFDWVLREVPLPRSDQVISVAVLAGGKPKEELERTLQSLAQQLFRGFEVLLPKGSAARAKTADVPARTIEVDPSASAAQQFNAALATAAGTLVVALEAGDVLAPHALYLAASVAAGSSNPDVIYGDEDELTAAGERANPFFKPDWSPELAFSFNYVGDPTFFRTETLRRIGGANPLAGDAWRWDLSLRAAEASGVERPLDDAVQHIPFVLCHRARSREERRRAEIAAGREIVSQALARRNRSAVVSAEDESRLVIRPDLPAPAPHVTVIVPTRDRCHLLRKCMDGLLRETRYPSFDVVVIDNRSVEQETLGYFEELRRDPRVTVIRYDEEFNFARIHNTVVPTVRGELVCLLNNDVEVIRSDWLAILAGHAIDPGVGAVGAKLLYPNGAVQHAGVAVGLNGSADHLFRGYRRNDPGPHGLLQSTQNLSAVTAACLVMRRSVYTEVGGMDEMFAVEFNDFDLCLNLRQHGYRIVWAANAELVHRELATRGDPRRYADVAELTAALKRTRRELNRFREKWSDVIEDDPLYNPNLTLSDTHRGIAFPARAKRIWKVRRIARGLTTGEEAGNSAQRPRLPAARAESEAEVGRPQRVAVKAAETVVLANCANGRPTILMVSHDIGGGTGKHVRDLVTLFAARANILLIEPRSGGVIACSKPDLGTSLRFDPRTQWSHLLGFLRDCGVARLHIHHMLGHEHYLRRLVDDLGRSFDFTLHDYYVLSPQPHLIGRNGRFVGEDLLAAEATLLEAAAETRQANSLAAWQHRHRWLLAEADRVIVPSNDVLARLRRYAPDLRAIVAAHPTIEAIEPVRSDFQPGDTLHIGLLGHMAPHKGSDVLLACAELVQAGALPLQFHLIGFADARSEASLRSRGVTITGVYRAGDQISRLTRERKPHLLWYPSQCPEVFSYTLSEGLQLGLPLVVPDIGAFAERLGGRAWAWIKPWNLTAKEWMAFFLDIRERNFASGTPPHPTGAPWTVTDEFYRNDYLAWTLAPQH